MTQSKFLEEKAKALSIANATLKNIIADYGPDKSIPWETVINLIEVYRMTQQLENTWVAKILTPAELKDYVNFEQELKSRFTESDKEASRKDWKQLVEDIHKNLATDPSSSASFKIVEHCKRWIRNLYGKNLALSKTIWERGFKEGHGTQDHGLSPEGVEWLDKAFYAYHSQKIKSVLDKIDTQSSEAVLKEWNQLLTDWYDDNQVLKDELIQKIMTIKEIPQSKKDWLKKHIL